MDAAAVTAITSAVDFATIVTGIGAVGAAVMVLKVSLAGMRALISSVRG